jgi:hypothetical protein
MYMLIGYPAGIIVEAVVLAKGKNRLRVAAAGFPDTVELRRSGSQWFTPTRQPVEIEFLMSDCQPAASPKKLGGIATAARGASPQ